jgi:murein L,D-transpeptidase YcbB/YkuD
MVVLLKQGSLRLRQRPGPGNALGLIKFVFPNEEQVYLHDTPAKRLFLRSRAISAMAACAWRTR